MTPRTFASEGSYTAWYNRSFPNIPDNRFDVLFKAITL